MESVFNSLGEHCRCQGHRPIVVDRLDQDAALGDREVVEAILRFAVPLAVVVAWSGLGANASTATCDDAGHASKHSRIGMELLVVPVPCDQQVETVHRVQLRVPSSLVSARKVGVDDLPICLGVCELLLQPGLLLLPQAPEEVAALVHGGWAAGGAAAGTRGVVQGAAEIVLWIRSRLFGVHGITVDHEDVHREAEVREVDGLAPIWRRHDPAVAGPRVGNLLVPTVVEDTAAPVVVPEHAQPRNAPQPGA
mmetsp:Transcript_6736/g.11350  ORF Transcript_6736/g.11350 Transcript_6736/m.11350 type:complete len:251 (+) Transcript_6736:235-987(+)